MPCFRCGRAPLLLGWRHCPGCGVPLTRLTVEFGFSRSKLYSGLVERARVIPGYSEEGAGAEIRHRIEVDVTAAEAPTWWRGDLWQVFRHVSKWKGTRLLREGQEVSMGTLAALFDAYVLAPAQPLAPWSPAGRGYFVER